NAIDNHTRKLIINNGQITAVATEGNNVDEIVLNGFSYHPDIISNYLGYIAATGLAKGGKVGIQGKECSLEELSDFGGLYDYNILDLRAHTTNYSLYNSNSVERIYLGRRQFNGLTILADSAKTKVVVPDNELGSPDNPVEINTVATIELSSKNVTNLALKAKDGVNISLIFDQSDGSNTIILGSVDNGKHVLRGLNDDKVQFALKDISGEAVAWSGSTKVDDGSIVVKTAEDAKLSDEASVKEFFENSNGKFVFVETAAADKQAKGGDVDADIWWIVTSPNGSVDKLTIQLLGTIDGTGIDVNDFSVAQLDSVFQNY
ncbi:MAG: hypothetical protein J5846_07510, partial [Desulfovibrio sp.]|nr:hypothetical protein [Desulfovibrio sp.]